jgi:hypothetical protein
LLADIALALRGCGKKDQGFAHFPKNYLPVGGTSLTFNASAMSLAIWSWTWRRNKYPSEGRPLSLSLDPSGSMAKEYQQKKKSQLRNRAWKAEDQAR